MKVEKIVARLLKTPGYMAKGAGWVAETIGCTKEQLLEAKLIVKSGECTEVMMKYKDLEDEISRHVDNEKGTMRSEVDTTFEPKSHKDLAILHEVDMTLYKISSYWTKRKTNGHFTSSLLCTLIKKDSEEAISNNFIDFLDTYKPCSKPITRLKDKKLLPVSLILPKQDAHFNKYDIMGDNSIKGRFDRVTLATINMVYKATAINKLEQSVYIVGSDQFNSEWTGLTTKGTPQSDILTYEQAFAMICDHEVSIISLLLANSDSVRVVFVPGNHDQYVGWHLVHFLNSYFRNEVRVVFDMSTLNTKYLKYGNSAIMLNHGDDMKAKDMVQKFPIGFKDEWSSCEHYSIMAGDKHHELSIDFGRIRFYQIPQLSSAKSRWDDKKGFESRAEMTAFIVSRDNGITDIYKEVL